MLKVCGVTYDHSTNYGSFFQAYALGRAIEESHAGGGSYRYALAGLSTLRGRPREKNKTLRARISRAASRRLQSLVYRFSFSGFDRAHMRYMPIRSYRDLPRLNDMADAFVCGSDVIWNTDFNRGLDAYYLGFAKKYKFAYSASFGRSVNIGISDQNAAHLRELDEISCREDTGCDKVEQITGRRPVKAADPVFLLKKEEWEQVAAEGARRLPEHYIFVYNTYRSPLYEAVINKLSAQTSLPVIRTTWRYENAVKQGIFRMPSPQEWLYCLGRADYVVTNSFHGTAFSLLFQRKFFTTMPGGPLKGANIRIWEILDRLGLKERIIFTDQDPISTQDVDYSAADVSLEAFRADSLAYLERNLEAAWRRKEAEKQLSSVNVAGGAD